MLSPFLLTSLFNLLLTRLAVSAATGAALFDRSPRGQAEWSRYCSSSTKTTHFAAAELLPHACFTIHDDITTSAHSSSRSNLGFASTSGEGESRRLMLRREGRLNFANLTTRMIRSVPCPSDFVVVAPKTGIDQKIDFYASGYWISVEFSNALRCTKVAVWVPTRAVRRDRRDGEEAALEPFMHGTSCHPDGRKTFSL